MSDIARVELGCPGHLIVARNCHWRRHTQIGAKYRVSTVGNYYLERSKRETIGAGPDDFFETMVFATTDNPARENDGCGCLEVVSFSELDVVRYATAGEAQAGHEAMVEKYLALAKEESHV